jgi:hypothetical protein
LLGILADATGSETREEIIKSMGKNDYDDFIKVLERMQKIIASDRAIVSSNAVCVRAVNHLGRSASGIWKERCSVRRKGNSEI